MEIASLFSIYATQYGSEIQSSSRRKEEKASMQIGALQHSVDSGKNDVFLPNASVDCSIEPLL